MEQKDNITRKEFIRNTSAGMMGMALAKPTIDSAYQSSQQVSQTQWKFVSIPDFTNVDVDFPEPKWDDALDYVLGTLKGEEPDFTLVMGDLVMGRWWRWKEQIKYMGEKYYTAWKKRMRKHGLNNYYVGIGDHDLGDNPWLPKGRKKERWMGTWDCAPIEWTPVHEKIFRKILPMPDNGPDPKKKLAYYVEHKNVLLVTLDLFSQELFKQNENGNISDIDQEQLQWLDDLLTRMKDKKFKIVQGHTPILRPVRVHNSSGIMLKGGRRSKLWQLMKKHGVDMYLCGEVHAITAIQKDGIQQIAHGSLFGYNKYVNYLAATVTENEIHLELKKIATELGGTHLSQSAGNEPKEFIRIAPKIKEEGFQTVGSMTISKKGNKKQFLNKTGYYFDESNNPKNSENHSGPVY